MSFADSLGDAGRKRGRMYAYGACLCGCVSEVMLDTSAIIILFMAMLGGGDMLMMLVNSFTGLLCMFLYIPSVWIIARIGQKQAVRYACFTGCLGYLMMACAPWFGPLKVWAAVTGCLIYCLQRSLYGACWYPLLDVFLRPQDRGAFFGTLRFMYYTFTGTLFFLIGLAMGKNPPYWLMQSVIALAGILVLGRYYFVSKFPDDPHAVREMPDIRRSLGISVRNGPLTAYSVYACLLTIAFTSLGPLLFIYLRNHVGLKPGTVQIISAVGMGGHILGFLVYGRLLKKFGIKKLELAAHLSYVATALALFGIDSGTAGFPAIAAGILFVITFTGSIFGCNNSAEMLALARPGTKTMATAFTQTYTSFGAFISRGGVSLVLGSTMLAPVWNLGETAISRYQSIFLVCGVTAAVLLALIPTLPAVVPQHEDYYEPTR